MKAEKGYSVRRALTVTALLLALSLTPVRHGIQPVLADAPDSQPSFAEMLAQDEHIEAEIAEEQPNEGELAETEPTEEELTEVEPTEEKPNEEELTEGEPSENETSEEEPAEEESTEEELVDGEPAEDEPAETENVEADSSEEELPDELSGQGNEPAEMLLFVPPEAPTYTVTIPENIPMAYVGEFALEVTLNAPGTVDVTAESANGWKLKSSDGSTSVGYALVGLTASSSQTHTDKVSIVRDLPHVIIPGELTDTLTFSFSFIPSDPQNN